MNSTKPERNAGIHRNRNVPFQTKNQNGTRNGFYNIGCHGSIGGKIGARLTTPSCNLRWEIVKFFNGTLEILPPPPPQILSPTSLPAPSQGRTWIVMNPLPHFAFDVFI